jgi:hypothetical protein
VRAARVASQAAGRHPSAAALRAMFRDPSVRAIASGLVLNGSSVAKSRRRLGPDIRTASDPAPAPTESFYIDNAILNNFNSYYDVGDVQGSILYQEGCAMASIVPSDAVIFIEVGSPCAPVTSPSDDLTINVYGSSTCSTGFSVVGDIATGWVDGFAANPASAGKSISPVITTDSDGDTNDSHEYTDGVDFYADVGYWALYAALIDSTGTLTLDGGDDLETGFSEPPSAAIDFVDAFNLTEMENENPHLITDMIDDGASQNTCDTASCYLTDGHGDPVPWTPANIWTANWGLYYDYGMPEIYNTGNPSLCSQSDISECGQQQWYGWLDDTVESYKSQHPGNHEKPSPIPTWKGVLYQCDNSFGNPSAANSLNQFAASTGQSVPFESEFYPFADYDPEPPLKTC